MNQKKNPFFLFIQWDLAEASWHLHNYSIRSNKSISSLWQLSWVIMSIQNSSSMFQLYVSYIYLQWATTIQINVRSLFWYCLWRCGTQKHCNDEGKPTKKKKKHIATITIIITWITKCSANENCHNKNWIKCERVV